MVTTPLYVGISGTHATGKTTLARRIEMELRASGFTVERTAAWSSERCSSAFRR